MTALADRLFVPAAFVELLAGMPAATAPAQRRWAWLNTTYRELRTAIAGRHGLEAIRLAQVIDRERHAAADEIAHAA